MTNVLPENFSYGPYHPSVNDYGDSNTEPPSTVTADQYKKLWKLVEASCIQDQVNHLNQDYGGGSTKSENTRAIRTFARELEIDSGFLNGLSRPWKTIADLFTCVECEVSTDDIRQVINRMKISTR